MRDAMIPSRTDDAASFIADRALSKLDEADDAAAERREAAAARVTFDDVLEELVYLHDAAKAELMLAVESGDSASCAFVCVELNRAKDRIVSRLLSEGKQS